MISTFIMSYAAYSQILYMYTPDHWCYIPQNYSEILKISNNETNIYEVLIPKDEKTMKRSQCFCYDPNSIDDFWSGNRSNWSQIKCTHGWQYNFTGLYQSITTQVNAYLLIAVKVDFYSL